MSAAVAPWLADLDEDWVQPTQVATAAISSLYNTGTSSEKGSTHERNGTADRKFTASLSSRHSTARRGDSARSQRRSILGSLSSSADNALRSPASESGRIGSGSLSGASAGSVVHYSSDKRRAQSSSPEKKQNTFEWKRRLVDGNLEYGDQTDLFGPSGLENIFQSPARTQGDDSSRPQSTRKAARGPLFRPNRFESMPSSPPPWPSSVDLSLISEGDEAARSHEDHDGNASHDSQDDLEQSLHDQDRNDIAESPHRGDESTDFRNYAATRERCSDQPHESGMLVPSKLSSQRSTATRITSAQSELSVEGFSPVFVSKHTTLNGEVGYAPLDAETAKLLKSGSTKPEERDDQSIRSLGPASSRLQSRDQPHAFDTVDESSLHSLPEMSLPDNLPTGTPPVARLGSFVTTTRGGLSNFGSFKNRPLSPSQHTDLLTLNHRGLSVPNRDITASSIQIQASTIVPRAPSPTPIPTTPPQPKEDEDLLIPAKTRSSASPLKLFGDYDTFTNKKLLRRMSQLEDGPDGREADEDLTNGRDESGLLRPQSAMMHHAASKLNSFGEGELDEFDFEADLSFPSDDAINDEEADRDGSPPPNAQPPGATIPFHFHVEDSECGHDAPRTKRKCSQTTASGSTRRDGFDSIGRDSMHRHSVGRESIRQSSNSGQHTGQPIADGKRQRSSPVKAPTPKRRRTLHFLDIEMHAEASQESSGQTTIKGDQPEGSVLVRPRNESGTTNFSQVFRPRNPTPSQRRREEMQAEIDQATDDFMAASPRLEAIQEKIDNTDIPGSFNLADQARAVASEVAAFTLNVSKAAVDGDRKRSITTQDFLNEAMHIMSIIRSRNRPQSGLGSVEESDEDGRSEQHLSVDDDRPSSALRISRPPSRDGQTSAWRPMMQEQQDPTIISRLRRFEESDDMPIVDTTFQSLHVQDREEGFVDVVEIEDQDLNPAIDIRISGPKSEIHHERSASDGVEEQQVDSFRTNPSIDYSTGRSNETTSTRKSDNVATLAPETVAHLIPERVAGMSFDRALGKWVRTKDSTRKSREDRDSTYAQSNITSDDDPFGNIPDLTVDELKEIHHIRSSSERLNHLDLSHPDQDRFRFSAQEETADLANKTSTRQYQPQHQHFRETHSSSVPSKYTGFESSQPLVETRATSWSNEEMMKANNVSSRNEHDDQTPEERSDPFDLAYDETANNEEPVEQSALDEEVQLGSSEVEEIQEYRPQRAMSGTATFKGTRNIGPKASLRRQTLSRALYNYANDQSEVSIMAELPDKRVMSVSVSVSRPPAAVVLTGKELMAEMSSPERPTCFLSDLPEFTVHEEDHLGPSEQALSRRVNVRAIESTGDRYALALQSLVKTLTDVEPDEPFWEDIRHLDLKNKSLDALHGLDDFCARLQALDISQNGVAQLEGAPSSLRQLNARSNSLHSLTAWSHLQNLQYLDISDNDIDDLQGLNGLMHLRELRADRNHVTSLDGVLELDGLLKLSVRQNQIRSVDLRKSGLIRLEALDLSDNELSEMTGVASLPMLEQLRLDTNNLDRFELQSTCARLRELSMASNLLPVLDVRQAPSLKHLRVDENCLVDIEGIDSIAGLELLSMRKQDLSHSSGRGPGVSILNNALHIRTLDLSSNSLEMLDLPHHYPTVQHLNLSSCGIASLPLDFGLRFPSLRSLNLNFNAIKEPRPLLNIKGLEELHLAGNRIDRLRKSIVTLARLPMLKTLDMRDNPITLGLYPSLSVTSRQMTTLKPAKGAAAGDMAGLEWVDAREEDRKESSTYLPAADAVSDKEHMSRLDSETSLRRRVYEMLLAHGNPKLQVVDGLDFDREQARKGIDVKNRLVGLGLLKRTASGQGLVVHDEKNFGRRESIKELEAAVRFDGAG